MRKRYWLVISLSVLLFYIGCDDNEEVAPLVSNTTQPEDKDNDEDDKTSDANSMRSFYFLKSDNPSLTTDTVFCTIEQGVITGRVGHEVRVDSLIPTFKADNDSVLVDDVLQESGKTYHDFKKSYT